MREQLGLILGKLLGGAVGKSMGEQLGHTHTRRVTGGRRSNTHIRFAPNVSESDSDSY
jgi:hypothetical protein